MAMPIPALMISRLGSRLDVVFFVEEWEGKEGGWAGRMSREDEPSSDRLPFPLQGSQALTIHQRYYRYQQQQLSTRKLNHRIGYLPAYLTLSHLRQGNLIRLHIDNTVLLHCSALTTLTLTTLLSLRYSYYATLTTLLSLRYSYYATLTTLLLLRYCHYAAATALLLLRCSHYAAATALLSLRWPLGVRRFLISLYHGSIPS
jgi:hypothetical protein